jgi:hypothetical protein
MTVPLKVRKALWRAGGFDEVHCLAGVAEGMLELRVLAS